VREDFGYALAADDDVQRFAIARVTNDLFNTILSPAHIYLKARRVRQAFARH